MNNSVPEEEKIALVKKLFSIAPEHREKYIQAVIKELHRSTSKDEVLRCLNKLFESVDSLKMRLN
jgi:hypothetical protein